MNDDAGDVELLRCRRIDSVNKKRTADRVSRDRENMRPASDADDDAKVTRGINRRVRNGGNGNARIVRAAADDDIVP